MAESVPIRPAARGPSLTYLTYVAIGAALVVVAAIFACLVAMTHAYDREAADASRAEQTLATAATIERSVIDVETGLRGYLLTHDRAFLEPYHHAVRELPALEARLRRGALDAHGRRQAAAILGATADYVHGYAEPVRTTGAALDQSDLRAVLTAGKRQVDALRAQFDVFTRGQQDNVDRQRARAEARGRRSLLIAIGGGALALVLLANL